MDRFRSVAVSLSLAALACASTQPKPGATSTPAPPPPPVKGESVFDRTATAYGFFPSPPEITLESVLRHFGDLGDHADFILVQPAVPWQAWEAENPVEAQPLIDLRNQAILAEQNGLEVVFVVDPLNGLNRREFMGLPEGWEASFANPDIRRAHTAFSLWIVRTFHPRAIGLASEINTYADAHPQDFGNFLSLYQEGYRAIKAEAPETQVFVSFQWEDLNNRLPGGSEGRQPDQINWEQIEAFEPQLDLWVISSYPFVAFPSGAAIPEDYYTPLLDRTPKPLAVAEGGFSSAPVGPFAGAPQDQVDYLEAIHTQLGPRLHFWVYLLLSDFDHDSYSAALRSNGIGESDVHTLELFESVGLRLADGTPKPALALWDRFRTPSSAPLP
jgi:hypothetical protein